jgi:hypothetical protein
MGNKAKPDFINVVPVTGKFCEVEYSGQVYRIWKVNPGTPNQFGTPLPYEVAVHLLGKVDPIISVAAEIKDGKRISPILEEDLERIEAAVALGRQGVRNYNVPDTTPLVAQPGSAPEVIKAIEALKTSTAQNTRLLAKLDELQKEVDALKVATGPAPASSTNPVPVANPVLNIGPDLTPRPPSQPGAGI